MEPQGADAKAAAVDRPNKSSAPLDLAKSTGVAKMHAVNANPATATAAATAAGTTADNKELDVEEKLSDVSHDENALTGKVIKEAAKIMQPKEARKKLDRKAKDSNASHKDAEAAQQKDGADAKHNNNKDGHDAKHSTNKDGHADNKHGSSKAEAHDALKRRETIGDKDKKEQNKDGVAADKADRPSKGLLFDPDASGELDKSEGNIHRKRISKLLKEADKLKTALVNNTKPGAMGKHDDKRANGNSNTNDDDELLDDDDAEDDDLVDKKKKQKNTRLLEPEILKEDDYNCTIVIIPSNCLPVVEMLLLPHNGIRQELHEMVWAAYALKEKGEHASDRQFGGFFKWFHDFTTLLHSQLDLEDDVIFPFLRRQENLKSTFVPPKVSEGSQRTALPLQMNTIGNFRHQIGKHRNKKLGENLSAYVNDFCKQTLISLRETELSLVPALHALDIKQTAELLELVEEKLRTAHYFEILAANLRCTDKEWKKAYLARRLKKADLIKYRLVKLSAERKRLFTIELAFKEAKDIKEDDDSKEGDERAESSPMDPAEGKEALSHANLAHAQ